MCIVHIILGRMIVRFKENFTLCVSGASGMGKTELVLHLLKNADKCMTTIPTQLIICYGCRQPFYEKFKELGIPVVLHEGVLQTDPPSGSLILFDDLQEKALQISDFFTKISHHLHVSTIYITQNIFLPQNRNITLNSNYIILFTSFRDRSQIKTLGAQIDPNNSQWIVKSYKDATKIPYSYILFDFTPQTDEEYRVRDNILPLVTHYYVDPSSYEYLDLRQYITGSAHPFSGTPRKSSVKRQRGLKRLQAGYKL